MLLDTFETTDPKVRLFVARHGPAPEDGAKSRIMAQEFGRAVGLFVIARRLHNKTCRPVRAQHLLQSVESLGHIPALVAQREEERFLEFLLLREKLLRLVHRAEVVPPETRAGSDAGVKQLRTVDQRMYRKQATQRVPNNNAVGMGRKPFLDFRDQLRLHEVEELVGAAAGGERFDRAVGVFYIGMSGRQITDAGGVGDGNDDEWGHKIGVRQEIDGAANFVDVRAVIRHVDHGVAVCLPLFLALRGSRHPHPDLTIFLQNVGMNDQPLWRRRRRDLGQGSGGNDAAEQKTAEGVPGHSCLQSHSVARAKPIGSSANAIMTEPVALTSGTKLGPYEILSPLGAGGMGEVYRAKDTRLDRTVAIKVLPSHLSSSPELKQRMEREAKAISALQHANICTLHDIGSQDGTDFLVMEYLEGQTLAERLAKGALPLDQVLKIATEIAQALEKAHHQGIIHRDLKPANIMLTKAGAKLMDFGLAKPEMAIASRAIGPLTPSTPTMNLASLTAAASPLTQKGSIVGTFQYMAPEVLQGAEADARSDLFSLGCVLYEMVTGHRAFEGKSQLSVFSAILEKDPDPISVSQPLAPPMLDRVVRACLAKDPADRIQSAHDVAMDLRWVAESG